MKVAVIGAGFTGLAVAHTLAKAGVDVVVYERDEKAGGLAIGFKEPEWDWTIEKHYHHWFTSDKPIIELAKEIDSTLVYKRVRTATIYGGEIHQLDSPLNLLKFTHLSIIDRFRTGFILFLIRYGLPWRPLEKVTAEKFSKMFMGIRSWEVLWEPLFNSKFAKYKKIIPMSWFWSRIKKRSATLIYPEGGYQNYVEKWITVIKKTDKVKFRFKSEIKSIKKSKSGQIIINVGSEVEDFDKVVCTVPFALFTKIVKGLPQDYIEKTKKLKGIGAINLVLSLKRSFFEDGTYWLNINDDMPFLAVVEHTNLADKSHYNNENLLYVGNYLEHSHKYFDYSKEQLIEEFTPHLKNINKKFKRTWIKRAYKFPAFFAQPIQTVNYSKKVPGFESPIEGICICNMQQIYPWDRGTNYSVEYGQRVADLILKEKD